MTDDSHSPPASDVVENDDQPHSSFIRETFGALIGRSGPAYHPIFDKFEPEHVTQFLQNVPFEIRRTHDSREVTDGSA